MDATVEAPVRWVSLCARCSAWCAPPRSLCDYCERDENKPSGWSDDNRTACDFFHRGIEPPNRPTPPEWLRESAR